MLISCFKVNQTIRKVKDAFKFILEMENGMISSVMATRVTSVKKVMDKRKIFAFKQ